MAQALNLVLVGMPGCGKTRVGKLVARILGRDFVDLDAEIVRSARMSIPEIFAKFGEARFRELEREEAKKVAARSGLVIATGGGTIVQPGAPDIFRATGKICYIRRPLELLQTAHGRPLSRDRAAVEKLYAERHEKYESAADFTVDNADAPPNQVAQKIAELFCR
jgi:shikimate kinase